METPLGTIPSALRAGDSWDVSLLAGDYPGPDWSLSFVLVSSEARHAFAATWDGSAHALEVAPEDTAGLAAGSYASALIATSGTGARRTLASGRIQVLPDPVTASPSALQSHARRMLAAIEACLEQRATEGDLDLVATAAGGRSANYDLATLRKLRADYAAQVAAEDSAESGAPRMVQMAFK